MILLLLNSVANHVHFFYTSSILSTRNGDSLCLKIILVALSFVYEFLTFILGYGELNLI